MYRIGVDLGGTNIAAGIVDENYKILATAECKTRAIRPAEEIADDIAILIKEVLNEVNLTLDDVSSFGIGSPGAINPETGEVRSAGNLGFRRVKLTELLRDRLRRDFYLENDANCASFGEYLAGAGKGTRNFVAITLGTGVGGGIIIDGKLYSGSNFSGAELGHIVINMDGESCNCGRQGCWETYASATALIRQTKQAMIKYPDSVMWEMCNGNINAVTGITAFDAMRKGDKAGQLVVEKYLIYVATGVSNVLNIFQPDVICIGGGISKEGDAIINPIREYIKGENFARSVDKQAEIKVAALGNDAGIIGAAFLDKLHE